MNTFKRLRSPSEIISHAVWLYYRFNLNHRDIEDLPAERGIIVSREAIRLWYSPKVGASGEAFASLMGQALRQIWCSVHSADETKAPRLRRHVVRQRSLSPMCRTNIQINGEQHYLWRAVYQESLPHEVPWVW